MPIYTDTDMTKPVGYKPFSLTSYNRYKVYEKYLLEKVNIPNYTIEDNPYQHGIDLLVLNDMSDVVGGLEAESHGKYWIDEEFPFDTCHFLYRKKKYIRPHNFYVMMNRGAKNALMLPFMKLEDYDIKIIDNAVVNQEKFYDVPIHECILGWDGINSYLEKYFNGDLPDSEYPNKRFQSTL